MSYFFYSSVFAINYAVRHREAASTASNDNYAMDIGVVSRNITMALDNITDLILGMTTLAGIGFIFVALAKLQQYRRNPQQVPISQFIVSLVMALVLLGLPLIIMYGDEIFTVIGFS
jgi:hypothetical protein